MLKKNCRMEKNMLMKAITEESFAISDILLYLDTHPTDEDALYYYYEHMKKRKELLTLHAEFYGPLTIDQALDSVENKWLWEQQPFPWEIEGGRSYVEL